MVPTCWDLIAGREDRLALVHDLDMAASGMIRAGLDRSSACSPDSAAFLVALDDWATQSAEMAAAS